MTINIEGVNDAFIYPLSIYSHFLNEIKPAILNRKDIREVYKFFLTSFEPFFLILRPFHVYFKTKISFFYSKILSEYRQNIYFCTNKHFQTHTHQKTE